ncbi:MAG: hypothetical protein HPY85_00695 [Anaerolineae bacterium]|jgi:hypothetical protein|nr:hypothetical protein [Anaerolineae bacterium]
MEQKKAGIPSGVIYILAWVICTILLVGDVLFVREATRDVLTVVQQNQTEKTEEGVQSLTRIKWGFIKETVDRGILIAGGIAAVVLSIYLENYFRKGREAGLLAKRVVKSVGILVGIMVVSIIIQTVV